MSDQQGFSFEAPLTTIPALSQLPPRPKPVPPPKLEPVPEHLTRLNGDELVAHLHTLAVDLPDDIGYDDLLTLAGFPPYAITAWHRSRMLDALLPPGGEFQAYRVDPRSKSSEMRFRRLPPLMPCPGEECGKPTRGGVLCPKCAAAEVEDLFNAEDA